MKSVRHPSWRLTTGAVAALAVLSVSACGSTVRVGASSLDSANGPGGTAAAGTAASAGTPGDSVATTGTSGSGAAGSNVSASGTPVGGDASSVPLDGAAGGPPVPNAPIQVGIVLTTQNSSSSGFSNGETYSEKDIDEALIGAMNKQGGFAGHKLTAVYSTTDPSSNNWSADFAAACANFTQDHHVKAVLGYVFNYDPSFETCLTNKNVPHLDTAFNVPDRKEMAMHPLHRDLAVPTIDIRSVSKLRGAIEDGVLTKKSKLAVVLDGCPGTERSWNEVSKPFLQSEGITPLQVVPGSGCPNGAADGASSINGVPNAILKARRLGIDTLTFLTVSEGPGIAIIAIAAEEQGWHPTYITGSLANLSALQGQIPPEQEKNIRAWGWMPGQDVEPNLQPPRTASQSRCIGLLASVKVKLTQFGDLNNAYRMCDALFAYQLALTKDGGNTTGANVIAALDGLGTTFDNPDVLTGATVFGPGHENNAPAKMRAVVFDYAHKRFTYTGPLRALR